MSAIKAQNILSSATGASASTTFQATEMKPVGVYAKGTIGASETVPLQSQDDQGSWHAVSDASGAAVALTATVQSLQVNGPGIFRLNKGITGSAAGAYIYVEA